MQMHDYFSKTFIIFLQEKTLRYYYVCGDLKNLFRV